MTASDLHRVCHKCPADLFQMRKAELKGVCLGTSEQNDIIDQCRLGCPLDLHHNPPKAIGIPREAIGYFPDDIAKSRLAWRAIHLLALDFEPEKVMRWLRVLPVEIPHNCACRKSWAQMLEAMPPDLSSPSAFFRWTVRVHNFKNAELGKPKISDARAARIYGVMHLLPSEEIASDSSGPVRLLINNGWGLGDAMMMSAALRNLHDIYPGEFEIRIKGGHQEFANLPDVVAGVTIPKDYVPDLYCHWDVGKHDRDRHTIEWLTDRLAAVIGRRILQGPIRAWAILNDRELAWEPPMARPYVVAAMGYKLNLTTKAYPHWQTVADLLKDVIPIVRMGAVKDGNVQPRVEGLAVDLMGKTSIRQMMAIVAHPLCAGTLSIDTSLPHIASAFDKPAVVIGGDRLPPMGFSYHGHLWISANLPCSGCERSRVVPLSADLPWPEQNGSLCLYPIGEHAKCMTMIDPVEVAQAVKTMVCGELRPH